MKKVLLTNKFDIKDNFVEYAVKYSTPDFYFDFYGNNLSIYHIDLFKRGFNFKQVWPTEIDKKISKIVINDVGILVVNEDSTNNHSLNLNYAISLAQKYGSQIVFIPLKNETFQYRSGVLVIGGDILEKQRKDEEFSVLITIDQGYLKNAVLNKHKRYSSSDYDVQTVKTFFGSKNIPHLKNKNVLTKKEASAIESRYNNYKNVDLTHLYNDHLITFKILSSELDINTTVHGLADQSFQEFEHLHDKPTFKEDDINFETNLVSDEGDQLAHDRKIDVKSTKRLNSINFNSDEYLQLVKQERRDKIRTSKDKYSDGYDDPNQVLRLNQDELISRMGEIPDSNFVSSRDQFGFVSENTNVNEAKMETKIEELVDDANLLSSAVETTKKEDLQIDEQLLVENLPAEETDEKVQSLPDEIIPEELLSDSDLTIDQPLQEELKGDEHESNQLDQTHDNDQIQVLDTDAEDFDTVSESTNTNQILEANVDVSSINAKKISSLFHRIKLFFKKFKVKKVNLSDENDVEHTDLIQQEKLDEYHNSQKVNEDDSVNGVSDFDHRLQNDEEIPTDLNKDDNIVELNAEKVENLIKEPVIEYPPLTAELVGDRGNRLERLAKIVNECEQIINQFNMITAKKSQEILDRFYDTNRLVYEHLLDKPIEQQYINGKFEITNDEVDAMINDFTEIYNNFIRQNNNLINLAKRINLQDFIANKTKLTTNILNDRKTKIVDFQKTNTAIVKNIEDKYNTFEKEIDQLNLPK